MRPAYQNSAINPGPTYHQFDDSFSRLKNLITEVMTFEQSCNPYKKKRNFHGHDRYNYRKRNKALFGDGQEEIDPSRIQSEYDAMIEFYENKLKKAREELQEESLIDKELNRYAQEEYLKEMLAPVLFPDLNKRSSDENTNAFIVSNRSINPKSKPKNDGQSSYFERLLQRRNQLKNLMTSNGPDVMTKKSLQNAYLSFLNQNVMPNLDNNEIDYLNDLRNKYNIPSNRLSNLPQHISW